MNKQSQQLVVAGVVAFLTSGIITLAGLSAAQDMNMGGMPPPGGDMGGGGFQGGDMGGGGFQGGDMGGGGFQGGDMRGGGFQGGGDMGGSGFQGGGDMGGSGFQGGDMRGGGFQGGNGQHFGDQGGNVGGPNFQKDGPRFQREGDNFQKDGPNFRPGASDFGGGMGGADRSFRRGFEGKTGAEHEGGRFESKPMEGFDRTSGQGKEGVFGKGTSYPMKGAPGGFDGENGPKFDMSDFDQFVPKNSNANVDSLLDSLPASESDAVPALTTAQESKVEKTLDKADTAEDKAVSGLQKIFAKKPTKSAATKATNHILTLVKQWVSVQKLADGLGDFESDVVEHAEESASSFANTIVEACDTASDFFDGKWKGEKVCDKVMDQIGTEEEE